LNCGLATRIESGTLSDPGVVCLGRIEVEGFVGLVVRVVLCGFGAGVVFRVLVGLTVRVDLGGVEVFGGVTVRVVFGFVVVGRLVFVVLGGAAFLVGFTVFFGVAGLEVFVEVRLPVLPLFAVEPFFVSSVLCARAG